MTGSKAAATTGAAVPGSIDKLAWMAGCWQGTSDVDGSNVRELWLAPAAGTMMGVSQPCCGSVSRLGGDASLR